MVLLLAAFFALSLSLCSLEVSLALTLSHFLLRLMVHEHALLRLRKQLHLISYVFRGRKTIKTIRNNSKLDSLTRLNLMAGDIRLAMGLAYVNRQLLNVPYRSTFHFRASYAHVILFDIAKGLHV